MNLEMALITLITIWGSFLFGGLLTGTYNEDAKRKMPLWTRIASSTTLVFIAWIWYVHTLSSASLVLAIGMSFGLIGDLFMAEIIPIKDYVIGGILAFSTGHFAYMYGFTKITTERVEQMPDWGILSIWFVIGILGWFFAVYFKSERSILHYAALPYSIILASTVAFANTLFVHDPVFLLIMIGSILFLISDLILAAELFRKIKFPYTGDVVWLLYGPGQMLIICGQFLPDLLK